MKYTILIGGQAGQGINKISEILSNILINHGYFIFNYRDYPSLIRGGHNFNILTISENQISSTETKLDGIVALDKNTIKVHQKSLKRKGFILPPDKYNDLGRNENIALAGELLKIFGISKEELVKEIEKQFGKNEEIFNAAEKGYSSAEKKFTLKKLNNRIILKSGTDATANGAINSNLDLCIAYPMTPATGLIHSLAKNQVKNNLTVFQAENEIGVANMALGASFTGAKVIIPTSGGGYDLMGEALSMQGMSEIPLTVYLCSRPGPGTGIPTYTSQSDLDIALRTGHGEFPRIVIAPGDSKECIEKTNEALYLAEKFKSLSIILSDKHLAESQFSFTKTPNKPLKIQVTRDLPGGEKIVKASSYEHDRSGNTTESPEIAKFAAEARMKKYSEMKKFCKKLEMIKIHGKKNSRNLIIGWGSTKGAILDSISEENLDAKFLQILYMKPLSNQIKKEMKKAKNIILVESNVTGQLGRLLREKTGIKIHGKNRILKYDSRPFWTDELKIELKKRLK
jgi:2-oxoglutarate/2-oxoacid ferredoxin oxidoreductase subunit alpha